MDTYPRSNKSNGRRESFGTISCNCSNATSISVLSEGMRLWSKVKVQLLGESGKTVTVEYFHPNVIAVDFFGAACGMLCIGIAILSGEVGENGRSMFVASVPKIKRFPSLGAGRYLINIFCSFFSSIFPSCKASYKLDHFR